MNLIFSGWEHRNLPRIKHIVALSCLVAFVAYFGVWRGSLLMYEEFGAIWGAIAGLVSVAGLIVIVTVGIIIIRTMRHMEGAPVAEETPDPPK